MAQGTSSAGSVGRTLTRLTGEAGVEFMPSLSPDGEWITYVARSGDDWDIFLRGVGATRTINLTEDHDGHDREPAFSPDGRSIAFWSARDGGGTELTRPGAAGQSSPQRMIRWGLGRRTHSTSQRASRSVLV